MDKTDKNMNRTKLKLSDLNPHLMCVLCGGYYIDATTIVECLHSFCRSCIVKHLESSKYCPICEVQVHKTKPLVNIRPDKTLQDIVYKLVPGLFASEMRNRRKFYRERPHYMKPNDSESVGEVSDESKIYINDENITLSLDYHKPSKNGNMENSFREISTPVKSEKRYFKCPTGVTVYHLQKLLKAKYDLNDSNYKVEIYFKDQTLQEEYTLLDISYIYLWKSKGTLDLTFKIFENVVKRQKIEEIKEEPMNVDQKEMDVRLETRKEEIKVEAQESVSPKPTEEGPKPEAPTAAETKSEPAEAKVPEPRIESAEKSKTAPTESVKQNGVVSDEGKEVQLQISESGVMSVSQIENGEVVRTVEESSPKIIDNFRNKSNTGVAPSKVTKPNPEPAGKQEPPKRLIPEQSKQAPKAVKPYKTIRCSPKSWNPVIPKEKLRPTLMKNSDEPKKPLKFFKMRNMPRFLGNPASGVKPLYAESSEKDGTERRTEERKDNTKALNILKIDPKTLRPIEKEDIPIISTPSTPNLLTNPFIPNNNHFLFSDPLLIHPNAGNFSNLGKSDKHNNNNNSSSSNNNIFSTGGGSRSGGNSSGSSSSNSNSNNNSNNNNSNGKASSSSRPPIQNGTFPPICFPAPDYCSNFYPYQNFPKPTNFYPPSEKMDSLMRASRLAPFGNLPGFNMAGFHASLPPSISLLLKQQPPHHHFKKASQFHDKKNFKEESTKDTNKNCDDDNSLKLAVANGRKDEKSREEEIKGKTGEGGKESPEEKKQEETRHQSAPQTQPQQPQPQSSCTLNVYDKQKGKEDNKVVDESNKDSNNGDNSEEEKKKKEEEMKKEEEEEKKKEEERMKKEEEEKKKMEEEKKNEEESKKEEKEKKQEEKKKEEVESTCQDATSACKDKEKPETIANIDKSVNDKER